MRDLSGVRVGLRPSCTAAAGGPGLPALGPVPGAPGLFLAAGAVHAATHVLLGALSGVQRIEGLQRLLTLCLPFLSVNEHHQAWPCSLAPCLKTATTNGVRIRSLGLAGHEGSGLTLGPATASLVGAHVCGREAELPGWSRALLPRLSLAL